MTDEEANNLVLFPPERIVDPMKTALGKHTIPTSIDQVIDLSITARKQKVRQLLDLFTTNIANNFHAVGLGLTEKEAKHLTLLIESLHSLLDHMFGLEHQFQEFAEDTFVLDEKGVMRMKPLKKEETNNA